MPESEARIILVVTILNKKSPGAATVESSMEVPQEIKNGSDLWPSDSTSGNTSQET